VFEVIHPFHPLYKQEFHLITYRQNWESHRVYFYNHEKRLVSIPTRWTSVVPQDPFVKQAAGRSLFKVTDLLRLSHFIEGFNQGINQIDPDNSQE